MAMPAWVPAESMCEISEDAALNAFATMKSVDLQLPPEAASGPCKMTYLKTAVAPDPNTPPLLLIHGFDISSLEYRRLMPLLEEAGIEAYAPCIPGWGFTDTTNMRSIEKDGKRAALLAFAETVIGRPAMWVGASLGACIALDAYCAKPAAFHSLATLDPAFFTEAPPVVPAPVGKLLLTQVLQRPSVRASIAKQAYSVKEDQTEDAIRCGNLHLGRPKYGDDSLEWLLSGAYGDIAPSVASLAPLPTLTLWGRQDEVIPPAGLGAWPAARLRMALPDAQAHRFRWVEGSGHTPHLEQPATVATALAAFARGEPIAGDADLDGLVAAAESYDKAKEAATKLGNAAVEKMGALGKAAMERVQEVSK